MLQTLVCRLECQLRASARKHRTEDHCHKPACLGRASQHKRACQCLCAVGHGLLDRHGSGSLQQQSPERSAGHLPSGTKIQWHSSLVFRWFVCMLTLEVLPWLHHAYLLLEPGGCSSRCLWKHYIGCNENFISISVLQRLLSHTTAASCARTMECSLDLSYSNALSLCMLARHVRLILLCIRLLDLPQKASSIV